MGRVLNIISQDINTLDRIEFEIENLLRELGKGQVDGVAYDTAWVARLAPHYPNSGFDKCIDWLRQHQHEDGTWGAPLIQYHDRFISTLAAIVALREVGDGKRDERRVKRGEQALWHLVGKLNRDDSDTIGFPILTASLVRDAEELGLDVPKPPIRFAKAYNKKVDLLLAQTNKDWKASSLVYSLEGLRHALVEGDNVFEENGSVSVSPAATASYVLSFPDTPALDYLLKNLIQNQDSSSSAFDPVDVFDIGWSLNHLRLADAVDPNHPQVRRGLDFLWENWSAVSGISPSTFFNLSDVDTTAVCFMVLKWGGYPVNADCFSYFELENHFCCYKEEANVSLSANVRLLAALQMCDDHPMQKQWIEKIVRLLKQTDENGSFWWDKWHASPYYVTSTSIHALRGVADELVQSRLKWILRTQNDDGGWGYLGESTPEETAYCLEALLKYDNEVASINTTILQRAFEYLLAHVDDKQYTALWIGKSLYNVNGPVKSVILSSLYTYIRYYDYSFTN